MITNSDGMFIAGKVDTDDLIVSDGSNREQNNDVV